MLMEFENITFKYPNNPSATLKNFSLQLKEGKKYALIGHNGCGKSTLFRLANGLYKPNEGVIRWRGDVLKYDRQTLTSWRQNVGLVFQNPEQQLVATTVESDLSYGLCNLGLSPTEIESLVLQALKDFDFEDLADFPVNHLSLGQKKRLAIADVMILKPQMLLLDEPTAFLDPKQIRQLQQQLQQISITNTTILIATHNLPFISTWADELLIMNQGNIILQGNCQDIFAQPQLLQDFEF